MTKDEVQRRRWTFYEALNLVVLDKERTCRYLHKGKIPDSEIPGIIALVKEYQGK